MKDKGNVTPMTEIKSISLVISITLFFFSSLCLCWLYSLLFPNSLFSVKTYDREAISELDLWLDDRINEWAFTPADWLDASPEGAGILFIN